MFRSQLGKAKCEFWLIPLLSFRDARVIHHLKMKMGDRPGTRVFSGEKEDVMPVRDGETDVGSTNRTY